MTPCGHVRMGPCFQGHEDVPALFSHVPVQSCPDFQFPVLQTTHEREQRQGRRWTCSLVSAAAAVGPACGHWKAVLQKVKTDTESQQVHCEMQGFTSEITARSSGFLLYSHFQSQSWNPGGLSGDRVEWPPADVYLESSLEVLSGPCQRRQCRWRGQTALPSESQSGALFVSKFSH